MENHHSNLNTIVDETFVMEPIETFKSDTSKLPIKIELKAKKKIDNPPTRQHSFTQQSFTKPKLKKRKPKLFELNQSTASFEEITRLVSINDDQKLQINNLLQQIKTLKIINSRQDKGLQMMNKEQGEYPKLFKSMTEELRVQRTEKQKNIDKVQVLEKLSIQQQDEYYKLTTKYNNLKTKMKNSSQFDLVQLMDMDQLHRTTIQTLNDTITDLQTQLKTATSTKSRELSGWKSKVLKLTQELDAKSLELETVMVLLNDRDREIHRLTTELDLLRMTTRHSTIPNSFAVSLKRHVGNKILNRPIESVDINSTIDELNSAVDDCNVGSNRLETLVDQSNHLNVKSTIHKPNLKSIAIPSNCKPHINPNDVIDTGYEDLVRDKIHDLKLDDEIMKSDQMELDKNLSLDVHSIFDDRVDDDLKTIDQEQMNSKSSNDFEFDVNSKSLYDKLDIDSISKPRHDNQPDMDSTSKLYDHQLDMDTTSKLIMEDKDVMNETKISQPTQIEPFITKEIETSKDIEFNIYKPDLNLSSTLDFFANADSVANEGSANGGLESEEMGFGYCDDFE
ncbi:hypothetical protein BC833DRAFT_583341 [Globomyces pollinis-pini]|nr:hypothetical protein BC833DRAFT_583341 [Globomyces pollinis-pini]